MTRILDKRNEQEQVGNRAKRGLLPTAGMAIIAALVLVTIVFFIADAVSGGLLVTAPGADAPEEITLGVALFSTVMGGLVGTGLAWVADRFAPRPRLTFVVVCVVGIVLYGIVPFAAAEETATGVWLNLMHVTVALPIVGGLATALPGSKV